MVLVLDTLSRRVLAAITCLGLSSFAALSLWSTVRSEQLSRRGTAAALQLALQMEPRQAELHNRLGRILFHSPEGSAANALASLERATQLDPHSAAYWLDLSLARELRGDTAAAALALRKAREAEPRTPRVQWHEVNYLLRAGRNAEAVAVCRELLHEAPEYTGRALPLLSHVADIESLIRDVVPSDPQAVGALMEFLRRGAETAGAAQAWERALAMGKPLEAIYVRWFLEWLLTTQQGELAQQVWRDAATRNWIPVASEAATDTLYNADFRQTILGYGFDWRVLPHPETSVWIEPHGPEPGQQSLCVQFHDDARAPYANVTKLIPVEPQRRYRLELQVRSDRLRARPGAFVRMANTSGADAGVLAHTDPIAGDTPWRSMVAEMVTGPDSRLASLTIVRAAPRADEAPASGMFCIANLRWTALGAVDAGAYPIRAVETGSGRKEAGPR